MTPLERLNFHHLHYFWCVAREGHLTRAAERLKVSQSALSAQIRQLEGQLGTKLFHRVGRRLELTEAGIIARQYADDIFRRGEELTAVLDQGRSPVEVLRIGAVATLSRNFQFHFLRKLLGTESLHLRLRSGSFDELVESVRNHELDLVLSNQPVRGSHARQLRSQMITRQGISIVGRRTRRRLRFPASIDGLPMVLPSPGSDLRTHFDELCEREGVAPLPVAEVEDKAMMRLLARESAAFSLVPPVVVRDELERGELREYWVVPDLYETFYAITSKRLYPHPLLETLLSQQVSYP